MKEEQYEKGLYQYDGEHFVKLEPSGETKLPVSPEAAEAVKAVRKMAQQCIGLRPDLSVTASALLLVAAELPNVVEHVRSYGARVYGSSAIAMPVVKEKKPASVVHEDGIEQEPAAAIEPLEEGLPAEQQEKQLTLASSAYLD